MVTPSQSPDRLTAMRTIGALVLILLATSATAATLDLTGPAGSTVSLNDRPLGQFPLDGPLDLPPGRYTVRCQMQGYVPYEQAVRLVSIKDWQRIAVRLTSYSRKTAWTSNLMFAGLGQHYLGHNFRGYVYNAAEAGGLLTALAGELQRSDLEKDYNKLVDLYNGAINADEITSLGNEAEAKYTDMQDMEELRDLGLMVAGGAIVISIIDAMIAFPSLAAGDGSVPVDTGSIEAPWNDAKTERALHAGLRLTF
ncbi:MAG: PEGA domain-containing protein [Candidatus Krumholzibacteria bacterium]|nr:PEGA domain-containing protein [Candidatus Krumholzibacteria bacterium]